MTSADDMARNIGTALAEGKLLNPYKLWKLNPILRTPEPNRKILT